MVKELMKSLGDVFIPYHDCDRLLSKQPDDASFLADPNPDLRAD
jgi:hypothetical protein